MKKNQKQKLTGLLLVTIVLLIGVRLISEKNTGSISDDEDPSHSKEKETIPYYSNLEIHDPIDISDIFDPDLAEFPGSGTWNDPYVIANLHINATGYLNGIRIQDLGSNYLRIENCVVFNASWAGIYITTDNCFISNNTVYDNNWGIFIDSQKSTIHGNIASDNGYLGIEILFSNDCNISKNIVINNGYLPGAPTHSGIYCESSDNIIISENIVSNSTLTGIQIDSSFNCSVYNNLVYYNDISGIFCSDSQNCSIYNNIVANTLEDGITVKRSYNCTFLKNLIIDNQILGINLDYDVPGSESKNITIWENALINNMNQARDMLYNNFWDNGTYGNYWSDYESKYPSATHSGGIWDTPYENQAVIGFGYLIDNYPLVYTPNFTYMDNDIDGVSDFLEVLNFSTDPLNPDTDGDGLKDGNELYIYKTDPLDPDTDDDSMPDGWEVYYALNATNSVDNITDPDNDYLLNVYEYLNNTNPQSNDTDYDSMPDGWEVLNLLNPTLGADNMSDPDFDLLLNIYEYLNGSDPQNNDTDIDSMPDGWEIFNLLNATDGLDNITDPDNDLLLNVYEYLNGTDPQNNDTDGDELPDWWEFQPLNNDIQYNLTAGTSNIWNVDMGVVYIRMDISSAGLCGVRMNSASSNPESKAFDDGLFYYSIDTVNESKISFPVRVRFYIPDSISTTISFITLFHFNGIQWVEIEGSLLVRNGIRGYIEYNCPSFSTYALGNLPLIVSEGPPIDEDDNSGFLLTITLTISLVAFSATLGLLTLRSKMSLLSRKANKSVYTTGDREKRRKQKRQENLKNLEEKLKVIRENAEELTAVQRESIQVVSNSIDAKIEEDDETKLQNIALHLIQNQLRIWGGKEEGNKQIILLSKKNIDKLNRNPDLEDKLKDRMKYLQNEVKKQDSNRL